MQYAQITREQERGKSRVRVIIIKELEDVMMLTLTVEETLHKLRLCSAANLMASTVLVDTTTSCIPAKHSPAVNHSIYTKCNS